jgi:protein SCO1/2
MSRRLALAAALVMSFGTGAVASADEARPGRPQPGDIAPNINLAPASYSIDVEEHLGNTLDRGVPFVDHTGKRSTLGEFFDGKRPVLLTMNYFRCPVLCNVQLNDLTESRCTTSSGRRRRALPRRHRQHRPAGDRGARGTKRANAPAALGRGDASTGPSSPATRSTSACSRRSWASSTPTTPSRTSTPTPAVDRLRLARGQDRPLRLRPQLPSNDLKFGLMEASEGRVGTTLDRFILSCFHYDATLGRYGLFAFGLLMRWPARPPCFLSGPPCSSTGGANGGRTAGRNDRDVRPC